jgi:hypothetical protein
MTLPPTIERVSHKLSLWLIPHHRNDHHPFLTRHRGLSFFLIGILVSQLLTNLVVGRPALTLGFATDIQKEALISQTNQQRVANGKGSLTESAALSQAALLKAQDMFAKDYWAHVSPDGTTPWHFFNLVGYKYQFAGENLAKGFDTSAGVIQGWLDSPSHRENMLNNNYKEIGMAVLNGQLQGESTTLVVQLFGTGVAGTSTAASTPTPTPTLAPTRVPTPTIVAISSSAASIVAPVEPPGTFAPNLVNPAIVLETFRDGGSLTANQQVLILSLSILAVVLLVDVGVLVRKRLLHQRPHALLHAMVIISLIGLVFVSGRGVIL